MNCPKKAYGSNFSVVQLPPCGFRAVQGSKGCDVAATQVLLSRTGEPQFRLCTSHAAKARLRLGARIINDPYYGLTLEALTRSLGRRIDALAAGIAELKRNLVSDPDGPDPLKQPGRIWPAG